MVLYSSGKVVYAYVEIEGRKIERIGEERGRDGGWYWSRDWDVKTLQTKMSEIAEEWPKFYEEVRKKVDDKLLSLDAVKRAQLRKEILQTKRNVTKVQRDLIRAEHKLSKLIEKL